MTVKIVSTLIAMFIAYLFWCIQALDNNLDELKRRSDMDRRLQSQLIVDLVKAGALK